MKVTKHLYNTVISKLKTIFDLTEREIRITAYNLYIKNPTYPVCEVILIPSKIYNVEYILHFWVASLPATCDVYFVVKHTGTCISLACHIMFKTSTKIIGSLLQPVNYLHVNGEVEITLDNIEKLKPTSSNLLTKCTVQRSHHPNIFVLEFIVYGPENENSFRELMHEIDTKIHKSPILRKHLDRKRPLIEEEKLLRPLKAPPPMSARQRLSGLFYNAWFWLSVSWVFFLLVSFKLWK